jgi:hypothetical protein
MALVSNNKQILWRAAARWIESQANLVAARQKVDGLGVE